MKPRRHNSVLILIVFFILCTIGGLAMVYFAGERNTARLTLRTNLKGYFQTHRANRDIPTSTLASFSTLYEDFEEGGLQKFQERKHDLKREVGKTLASEGDTAEKDRAENIALYLFPDLLSNDDFERDVALEQWYPQQKAIEETPGTTESRRTFEELKNNVWNYENPDRQVPVVSDYAEEVIRIYDVLSRVE